MAPRNYKSRSRLPSLFREPDFEPRSGAVGLLPKSGAVGKKKQVFLLDSALCLSRSASVLAECLVFMSYSYICGLQFS